MDFAEDDFELEQGSVRWVTTDNPSWWQQRHFSTLGAARAFAKELAAEPEIAFITLARRLVTRWRVIERIK